MSKALKPKPANAQTFIDAGLKARDLRKQLAVTWLASQEIIDAMRALRAGIKIPAKAVSSDKDNTPMLEIKTEQLSKKNKP